MMLGITEVRSLLDRYSIIPSRSLGQNFVIDPNIIRKIIRLAELQSEDQVLEIGPGIGALTCGLEEAKRVIAIEFDRYLLPPLKETLQGAEMLEKTEILHADAMEIKWDEFFSTRPGTWKMISNLPYNISSTLLLNILDHAPQVTDLLVMVQREVGERFAAGPGTASYGIPSVKAQYWSEVSIVGNVPPKVFFPAPNVDSVMLKFSRRLDPEKVDLELMWRLLKIGFGQRRKMLRKSLKGYIGIAEFNSAGLDPKSRPQDLTVNDWVSLAIAAENGEHSEN
ncbi:MAG: 16S rRNA (adenine(1518)-N(6)/adenine(1519)-N(6))-dimethyltransferase [Acidimicrobiaceae bacterium]|jgi:16S rRNA (adenine1518-N6/adenine1519-N6)-dimethyltransferase|nr:16S rRNA (adenine(1518)-N(6)/adenine(1519)-N(6))-dimethyltransferase [Acidimicrobiaceae bacterium]|tara:strand:- start:4508 stop:5350 length:843 start_codon:yes stop_codon:yes gene_type:complete